MTYELAKQLKDAGFPFRFTDHDTCPFREYYNGTQELIPTLSELIEACGDMFGILVKYPDFWTAVPNLNNDIEKALMTITNDIDGSTPEEAVAKLWLALNVK